MSVNLREEFSFWTWWFKYGLKQLLNCWLILHVTVGLGLAFLVKVGINQVALYIVIPLVGVLIGLSFAWVGNAMALLQTPEIQRMTNQHKRGLRDYIYSYQASILILLICIITWSLIGLELNKINFIRLLPVGIRFIGKVFLFSISSLAIRECWQIILSTQWLLLSRSKIIGKREDENE